MGVPAWRHLGREGVLRVLALGIMVLGMTLGLVMLASAATAAPVATDDATDGSGAVLTYPAPPPAPAPVIHTWTPPVLAPVAAPDLPTKKHKKKAAAAPLAPVTVTVPAPDPTLVWAFDLTGADGAALAGRELHHGDRLHVAATGLPAGATVSVELHSTPIGMGSATVDASGGLDLTIVVPEAAAVGDHRIVATLSADGYADSEASVPVTVAKDFPWLSPTVPTLFNLELTPFKVVATASLASAFLLLAAVPAELLQSTLTENYARAFGWIPIAARRRAGGATRGKRRYRLPTWLSSGLTVAAAALILGIGRAGWSLERESLVTYVSLFLSLTALNLGLNAVRVLAARRRLRVPGRMIPLPGSLTVVVVSVVVSQVLHIEPTLMFGIVVSVQFGRSMSERHEGRLALLGVSAVFTMGVIAWILLSILDVTVGRTEALGGMIVEETLAAITLETLAALVVGLLPFTYLEGKAIRDWSPRIWLASYFVAAVSFVLIAVPTGASWEESETPLITWLLICAGFGVVSLTAWAVFRFTPEGRAHAHHVAGHHGHDAPPPEAPPAEAPKEPAGV
ncbi:hypothetical protein [Demequina soli]|uniref:hypothetical protein n=1 Tax=Demequina soli TaxID=1638987 RepID=UPI0007852E65|nr:hypothetical protein [Demequina soli]